jgi:hypothetical protein
MSIAAIAWAAGYDYLYFKEIVGESSGVALKNAAGKAIDTAAVKVFSTPAEKDGSDKTKGSVTFYYADGASLDQDNAANKVVSLDFVMQYMFKSSTDSVVQCDSNTRIEFTYDGGAQPETTDPIISPDRVSEFKSGHITLNGATTILAKEGNKQSSIKFFLKPITIDSVEQGKPTRTGGSDWTQNNNAGGGLMLVGVNYPEKPVLIPEAGKAQISPVSVDLVLNAPYTWKSGSVDVMPKEKNGISAKMYPTTGNTGGVAVVHFTGTPIKAEDTDFIVLGAVLSGDGQEVVLEKVQKLIRITPADPKITRVESEQGLSFTDGTKVPSGTKFTEVVFNSNQNANLAFHNLFSASGTTLFKGSTDNKANWNGMTITRTFEGSRVRYDFSGTPDTNGQTRSDTFYAAGLLNDSRSYRLTPFTVTIRGTEAPAPSINLADITPLSISKSDTALTTALTRKVTTTSGDSAVIEAIGLTATPSGSAMLVTLTNTKLTVAAKDDTLQVTGTPSIAGSDTVYIKAKAKGGASQIKPFTLSVTASAARELTVSGDLYRKGIIVTPTTALPIELLVVSSPDHKTAGVTGVTAKLSSHETGLSVSCAGNRVILNGKKRMEGKTTLIISGSVDGTPRSISIPVVVTMKGTIQPISPLKLTTGKFAQETIEVKASSGTVTLSGVEPSKWNGLALSVSGSKIAVTGTPVNAASQKFTVAGSLGSEKFTGEFTITAVSPGTPGTPGTPVPADELGAPNTWKKERRNTHYTLGIPMTKKFIVRFDANGDGKLTASELKEISAAVKAPNADLNLVAWDVSGNTLTIDLEFEPKNGHAQDWYKNLILESLTFTGSNGETASYAFKGGVELEKISAPRKSGSGGGCDAGASFVSALLLPFLASLCRRKKR